MDRKTRKDIARRYDAMQVNGGEEAGRIVCYECPTCGRVMKSVARDGGVTPMGIDCPSCGETAYQQDADYPNVPVSWEWYRPTLEEVLAMAEGGGLFTVSMVLNGMLLRREVGDEKG